MLSENWYETSVKSGNFSLPVWLASNAETCLSKLSVSISFASVYDTRILVTLGLMYCQSQFPTLEKCH